MMSYPNRYDYGPVSEARLESDQSLLIKLLIGSIIAAVAFVVLLALFAPKVSL